MTGNGNPTPKPASIASPKSTPAKPINISTIGPATGLHLASYSCNGGSGFTKTGCGVSGNYSLVQFMQNGPAGKGDYVEGNVVINNSGQILSQTDQPGYSANSLKSLIAQAFGGPPVATPIPASSTKPQPSTVVSPVVKGLTVDTGPAPGAFQSNHNNGLAIKAQMEVTMANSTGQIPAVLSNLQFGSDGLPIFAPPAQPTNASQMTANHRLFPPPPPSYLTSQSSPPPRTGNPQAVGGIITPFVTYLIQKITGSSRGETGGNMSGDGGEPNSGGNNSNSSSNSSNNAEGPSDGGIYGPNSDDFGRGTETMTNSEADGGEAVP